jgi:beta-fructofuranosidase
MRVWRSELTSLTNMPSYLSLLAALASLSAPIFAQDTSSLASASESPSASASVSPSSIFSQSNVPTGTPLPGNYGGEYRPQVHFSPPQGFMNDPNGMFVDADGVYHLYYQCKSSSVCLHSG